MFDSFTRDHQDDALSATEIRIGIAVPVAIALLAVIVAAVEYAMTKREPTAGFLTLLLGEFLFTCMASLRIVASSLSASLAALALIPAVWAYAAFISGVAYIVMIFVGPSFC